MVLSMLHCYITWRVLHESHPRRSLFFSLYYALLTSLNLPDTKMLAKTKHKDRATPQWSKRNTRDRGKQKYSN